MKMKMMNVAAIRAGGFDSETAREAWRPHSTRLCFKPSGTLTSHKQVLSLSVCPTSILTHKCSPVRC